jgi:hypothetical protein
MAYQMDDDEKVEVIVKLLDHFEASIDKRTCMREFVSDMFTYYAVHYNGEGKHYLIEVLGKAYKGLLTISGYKVKKVNGENK